jgi:GxxExxY protein
MGGSLERSLSALSGQVIREAMQVHTVLGPGLLESAYEVCLAHALERSGLSVARQVPLPVVYQEVRLDAGYRLDILVNEVLVVEVKAVDKLTSLHLAQLVSYLRLGDFRLGLLLNFNVTQLRHGIKRVANKL